MSKNTPKKQALKDMSACGININFLIYSRDILEITATDNSIRIDFRKFNQKLDKLNNK